MLRKFRLWKLRRQARKVKAIVRKIDLAMNAMGMPRADRRRMWREVIKDADARDDAFSSLAGDRA